MSETNIDQDIDQVETDAATLVEWDNPPSLAELKADFESAQVAHDVYNSILDNMEIALATSWQNPFFEVSLPKAVTSIVNA